MKENWTKGWSFIIIVGVLFLAVVPIAFLIFMSFSQGWIFPEVLPRSFGLRAWEYIFSSHSKTGEAILNSLYISIWVTLINLILALPAGDALGRYEFKGKRILEFILLMPIVIPPIVVLMGMHKTYMILGLTESFSGVILSHIMPTLPYMIRSMTISFQHLGFLWEDQARMLGAGKLKAFIYVLLPFLLPGMITGATMTILISFSQYIITLLIGGGQILTLSVPMLPYINGGDQAIGAAYSILFATTAIFALLILDRFLKQYYK